MSVVPLPMLLTKDVIWALKAHHGELEAEQIANKIRKELGPEYPIEEVEAALRRLVEEGAVEKKQWTTYRWKNAAARSA
jgi:Fe2+ or Zn2+ uptake regulation protein